MYVNKESRAWLGIGYLVHPVPALAVILLVINDHYFKQSYPNWITGKLSDFAGLFFFPLFLIALYSLFINYAFQKRPPTWITARQLAIALLITDVVFVAIKLFEPATNIYLNAMNAIGFPSRVTVDATDLLALSSNAATWIYARRFWR